MPARSICSVMAVASLLAFNLPAQERGPIRFYGDGGVGVGRFIFLCASCGDEQTSLVPSFSAGVTLTRLDLDLGFNAIGWSHIGDRFTVLTVGTTYRPRWAPFFLGGGVGLSIRQFAGVCTTCGQTPGTPVLKSGATDAAAMVQFGARIAVGYRVGLEPFAQFSRLGAGAHSEGHANHLAIGIRIDGR